MISREILSDIYEAAQQDRNTGDPEFKHLRTAIEKAMPALVMERDLSPLERYVASVPLRERREELLRKYNQNPYASHIIGGCELCGGNHATELHGEVEADHAKRAAAEQRAINEKEVLASRQAFHAEQDLHLKHILAQEKNPGDGIPLTQPITMETHPHCELCGKRHLVGTACVIQESVKKIGRVFCRGCGRIEGLCVCEENGPQY